MSNYLEHMQKIGGTQAFARRVDYLKYNYFSYLSMVDNNNKKVLEIGPGTGELLHILNQKGITNIDILDNDPTILAYCAKKYRLNKTILSRNLDLSKSIHTTYDLIVLTQVFEHIPKSSYYNWIKVLYNALNPGGHIIITVPNGANPFVGAERYGDLQHENVFTIYSFSELMTFANLKGSSYQIMGFKIPTFNLINIIRAVLQKNLHRVLILLMIINGGIYQTLLTPNISLVIHRRK